MLGKVNIEKKLISLFMEEKVKHRCSKIWNQIIKIQSHIICLKDEKQIKIEYSQTDYLMSATIKSIIRSVENE